jgi:hypothetical protein
MPTPGICKARSTGRGETNNTFFSGDTVNFTDAGLAHATVDLAGALQAFAVNVSNTTGNYTLGSTSGGSLAGSAVVTKTGAGTLTLQTANTYSGRDECQRRDVDRRQSRSPGR